MTNKKTFIIPEYNATGIIELLNKLMVSGTTSHEDYNTIHYFLEDFEYQYDNQNMFDHIQI